MILGVSLVVDAQTFYTLEQCIDSARANNWSLKNAAIEMQRSDEQKAAIYTKYFPSISANVNAFHAFDKLIKGDGTYPQELAAFESLMPGISQMVGQPFEISELNRGYGVTLSVMQPIYAGGQIHTKNQLASVEQGVMALQQLLKEDEVVQKVTENYWQIAQLKYNLQTLDAAERQVDAVLKQVNQYVKAGVTTSNDLLRVQLRQQELLSNRLKVENGISLLQLLLSQQCGIHGAFDIVLPETSEIILTEQVDPQTAASQRKEYQLAAKGAEAERLQIKLERGKCLPTVAVGVVGMNTGFGGLSSSVSDYMKTNITNGLLMATVSVPISEWWTGSHSIRRQKLKHQEALNTQNEALEKLSIDIQSAWNNLEEAQKQVSVFKIAVEQSKENLRQNTIKYNSGTSDLTDLLDAETLHRQSENNLSSAIADYEVKLADYKRKVK